MKMFPKIALFSSFAFILTASSLRASWIENGIPICTAQREQWKPHIATNGAGGAFITWYDYRSGNTPDIYAQHIDASGNVYWTSDGIAVCVAIDYQTDPYIASDGNGGAIIAWSDFRNGIDHDIYAQHIDSSGNMMWDSDGVAISTAASTQAIHGIISDGKGGAIIVWTDKRSGGWHVYAQRVNALGNVLWTPDGLSIVPGATQQFEPRIISDGGGGAIIAWDDTRSGFKTDIYAQRVNATGILQWLANGVPICTETQDKLHPEMAPDGAGGAIITWYDQRLGYLDINIYAQRVDSSGAVQWIENGVTICSATRNQREPKIVSDGLRGAIITWEDLRNGSFYDVYAQRVDSLGNALWFSNGVPICIASGDQANLNITYDGAAGAIIAWQDDREATVGDADIYAQMVDSSGIVQWETDGVPLCTAPGDQSQNQIIFDDAGGAIIVWQDTRSDTLDIYAQLIDKFGRPGRSITGITDPEMPRIAHLDQNYPNPFNPQTKIPFQLEEPSLVSLQIYDTAGRLIRILAYNQLPAGEFKEVWDGRDQAGHKVCSGIYFYRLQAGGISASKKMILLR